MPSKDFRGVVILLLTGWFLTVCVAAGMAQTRSDTESLVDGAFQKARESFIKKGYDNAASEIRKASAVVAGEGSKAEGQAKEDLAEAARKLDVLAERVEKKRVESEKELESAFAEAERTLARHYEAKGSQSWVTGKSSLAGKYLASSVDHFRNALSWAGKQAEEGSRKALQNVREVAGKLERGLSVTESDAKAAFETMKKEIESKAHSRSLSGLTRSPAISVATGAPQGSVDLSTAIVRVAKQVMPAVVYIEVSESREVENPLFGLQNDPFFRRFFGGRKMPQRFKQEVQGLGSGMIIDAEGDILTNYHVAGEATKMQVTLSDGSRYPAKLVGGDAKTDLAVIRISAEKRLPYVTFGDSDAVEVGEWVVAIGAPRALEKSITQGIISAKHRSGITDPEAYQDFLQADAPINPGNSGGPLLNLHGQVIGVNAAIASQSGGFEGIGFTIPSRMAVYTAKALMAHGKVERGWLGVSISNVTPEAAKEAHAQTLSGALVVDVIKGSPAEKAGLMKNDIVIRYEGKDIADSSAFRNRVAETPVGTQAKLTVRRGGKEEDLQVKMGSPQEAATVLAGIAKERLGVEVRPPTPKEIEKYGLEANHGVVISAVEKNSALGTAGFEVEDMILSINDRPVSGTEGFAAIASSLPPKKRVSILALDHRTGNTGTIMVVPK